MYAVLISVYNKYEYFILIKFIMYIPPVMFFTVLELLISLTFFRKLSSNFYILSP